MIKVVVILFILIGMAYAAMQLVDQIEEDEGKFQVAIDEATRQAVEKGEFQFPDDIVPVESKDCEGTQWIKQQECSLNGKPMDGTEGSCGPGKEIWILDQTHSSFKPATGDGKCEPQERDCSVECPKPCEGDTWTDTGRCVRKEYDTRGNVKEVVLDGTEGKCGEGISELNLDTTAPDYKPAIGKGECPMTKGGYCNVPCPKPEPPKCNSYTGWVENVGLGCVRSEDDDRKVRCGQKGKKMSFNVATDATNCPELVKWETCDGPPCPIDCEGSWSGWSAPKADEPCGVQPYKESIFTITTAAQHGGYACDYPHNDKRTRNSGTPKECCIEHNNWAKTPGSCNNKGLAIYTQSFEENKPGGCPDSVKSKKMACCYQKGDWKDITECNSVGKKTQKQTWVGNCDKRTVETRDVDCEYVGGWSKTGGCGSDGKQWYSRTTVNSNKTTSKSENCCYPGVYGGYGGWSACNGSTRSKTRYKTPVNCPAGTATSETESEDCNHCEGEWQGDKYLFSNYISNNGSSRFNKYGDHKARFKYKVTKSASNGGNSCPHYNGETREISLGECSVPDRWVTWHVSDRCPSGTPPISLL